MVIMNVSDAQAGGFMYHRINPVNPVIEQDPALPARYFYPGYARLFKKIDDCRIGGLNRVKDSFTGLFGWRAFDPHRLFWSRAQNAWFFCLPGCIG